MSLPDSMGSPGSMSSPHECLPHRPPFVFLSTITEVVAGDRAQGAWVVDGAEDFFRGHFPGDPIVPGVLIIEAMAQIAGVALFHGQHGVRAMVVHTDIRFRRPVRPPATIEVTARCTRSVGGVHLVEVRASVDSALAAQGKITLGLDKDAQTTDAQADAQVDTQVDTQVDAHADEGAP
ncbi:beta-hydroxyacyl-ACP dehydratase [Roseiflexus sp. AH-315-K22]|nr:beta-hydroxyacyl-ACP dehydratase [Roseiflexus sp. AH-315-K22]